MSHNIGFNYMLGREIYLLRRDVISSDIYLKRILGKYNDQFLNVII